ncbi:hypothetical protein ACFE04_015598 [Oxalis oulophora]
MVILKERFNSTLKLEALDMSYSALNSKFLQSIQDMDALKVLSLRSSGLNGSLSESQGLCDSRHLEVLDLSDNHLEVYWRHSKVPHYKFNVDSKSVSLEQSLQDPNLIWSTL